MNTCLQKHVLFPGFIEAARRLDTASFFCLFVRDSKWSNIAPGNARFSRCHQGRMD